MLIISLLIYFVFNPRLKIRNLDDYNDNTYFNNFPKYITITIFIFCLAYVLQSLIKNLMLIILNPLGVIQISDANMIIPKNSFFNDQLNTFLFLAYVMIFSPIFLEIIHRRTVIPLLEDRGSHIFYALVISSIGLAFPDLPPNILNSNLYTVIPNVILDIVYGLAIGFLYLLTRRILYPIILVSILNLYRHVEIINYYDNDPQLYDLLRNTFMVCLLVLTIISIISTIYFYKSKLYKTLFQRIKKKVLKVKFRNIVLGIIGFSFIALLLLAIQTIAIIVINEISTTTTEYLLYSSLFYVIAFSIPFYFTITTQYVKDQ